MKRISKDYLISFEYKSNLAFISNIYTFLVLNSGSTLIKSLVLYVMANINYLMSNYSVRICRKKNFLIHRKLTVIKEHKFLHSKISKD